MPIKMHQEEINQRQTHILQSARWCFLNFGFKKTSLEDIANRAHLSPTLLYKHFKDKEQIFINVFVEWLVSRQPSAKKVAHSQRSSQERLMQVSQLLILEPWADRIGAPMGAEFYDICEQLAPSIVQQHQQFILQCVAVILQDEMAAKVFLLALNGQLADNPTTTELFQRTKILVDCFTAPVSIC
ncbi:TetR/AcrR family transcriptional regulator [Providencia stuartii]|uniref:TetR/AcrR family transcriptional regulator n=1 Tax=Providencia stuartii TaxID=588 RepID=UPI0023ECD1C5|nr:MULTISPECIES: TetR/AcrR family transcriptional regulator [Providencia]MDF4175079.1 TetR/AcrR family transcriptional regulator [Providencia thailandensis]CAK6611905.1 DNA-binding protein, AcrR family, includes nucleoid occlusion protein SlmA [Providencia stuartii]CAK6613299.1 DNA-binding protein, AcrR family, includes nucleoid occlusion protein SlmA [Providencia stuartii]